MIAAEFVLRGGHHAVVIPGVDVPGVPVEGAVDVKVPVLGIHIAGENHKGHPVGNVLAVEVPLQQLIVGDGVVIDGVEHFQELCVVCSALGFQDGAEGSLVIRRVGHQPQGIILIKFTGVDLVQIPVLVQPVGAQGCFVQLLHLGIQAIVHKFIRVVAGEVPDIQVDELGAQGHDLGDFRHQVIGQLVAEAQSFTHVLVQGDGALTVPAVGIVDELDFIIFLGVPGGGLSANLHRGVGNGLAVAQKPLHRAVFVPHLQQGGHLIAVDTQFVIVVSGVGVDLLPGVVGAVGGVALPNGEVHGHHVLRFGAVQAAHIPQMEAVDVRRWRNGEIAGIDVRRFNRGTCVCRRGFFIQIPSRNGGNQHKHRRKKNPFMPHAFPVLPFVFQSKCPAGSCVPACSR